MIAWFVVGSKISALRESHATCMSTGDASCKSARAVLHHRARFSMSPMGAFGFLSFFGRLFLAKRNIGPHPRAERFHSTRVVV